MVGEPLGSPPGHPTEYAPEEGQELGCQLPWRRASGAVAASLPSLRLSQLMGSSRVPFAPPLSGVSQTLIL